MLIRGRKGQWGMQWEEEYQASLWRSPSEVLLLCMCALLLLLSTGVCYLLHNQTGIPTLQIQSWFPSSGYDVACVSSVSACGGWPLHREGLTGWCMRRIPMPLCGYFSPLGLLFQPKHSPAWWGDSQHLRQSLTHGTMPAVAITEDPWGWAHIHWLF